MFRFATLLLAGIWRLMPDKWHRSNASLQKTRRNHTIAGQQCAVIVRKSTLFSHRLCPNLGQPMAMSRLDQALVERALCDSREKAKRLILAGLVRINGQSAHKPSDSVKPGDLLTLDAPEQFVSRGGHKLEHALKHFQLEVTGLTAIDLGASTGGFTDCLLQRGAGKVFAVDVGQGHLAWKLRHDPRVVVMEKTNARGLTLASFPPPFVRPDLVVIDCSFISLRTILPPAVALLRPQGEIVALIKP